MAKTFSSSKPGVVAAVDIFRVAKIAMVVNADIGQAII